MPALTAIPEMDLWTRWKERGDESAREELIVRHMRIVKFIAGRMAIHVPSSVEMDDLIGWGVLGLLDAIDRYDHRQDIKFTTYASIRVRGSIIDQIRTLDWAPRSLRAMARKLGEARDKLRHELGREPTADAIAGVLGTTIEHVEDTVAQLQTAQVLSLQDYVASEDGGEPQLLDVMSDPRASSPDAAMTERERQERIVQAINGLPDPQQKVLHLYYYKELTLKEIGAVLEVTESRVCQIHSAAMKTLRKAVRGDT
ncbi:MAG: FliA/WhiG family RNA polymerase sigma factor [Candidatus Hydrogenedentes bacterium]|nr:FliA/WhiG family RNA polymerase sigma factor [Candidatus Hydrogenedentota bacterium]